MNNYKKAIFDWQKVRAVIFDIDGTLYDQRMLRILMFFELLKYYLVRPNQWKDVMILRYFRLLGDRMTSACSDYDDILSFRCHMTAEKYNIPVIQVETCVKKWIFIFPLRYLKSLRFPGIVEFCCALEDAEIKLAAFSDYPAKEKLKVLDFPKMLPICSIDREINRLKPDPKGLLVAAKTLSVPIDSCLLIGDRNDKDGESARRINMPYLIKTKYPSKPYHFKCYRDLHDEFNRTRVC